MSSCGKSDAEPVRENLPASTKSAHRGRLVLREDAPQKADGFREQLDNAMLLDSPSLRDKALADIAWNSMETDLEIAHQAFRQLSVAGPERMRLIRHYAIRLAEQNPDEAVEWASTLDNELETATAMAHIALETAENDPQRAANLLAESTLAGRDLDVVVVQVIQRWAAQSPPEAAAWVASFPPGAAREAGVKTVVERWLPHHPSGTFEWLARIQEQDLRAEAARAMQGIILQQPKHIRESWLQDASTEIRDELQRHHAAAVKDVGNNIPSAEE